VGQEHWTQLVPRVAVLLLVPHFLWTAALRIVPGRGTLLTAWTLVALVFAFPALLNQWAPQERMEKQLLFGQMNRVVDEMERTAVEEQRDWRDWQDFSGQSLSIIPEVKVPEETMGFVLFSPSQWYRLLEDLFGLSREFLGFFRPLLLVALLCACTFLLLGLHLASGQGVVGFRRGLGWGLLCYLVFLGSSLFPRCMAEYTLVRSEEAARQGETEEALKELRAAGDWWPALNLDWSYHAKLGRLIRWQNRETSPEPFLAEAHEDLQRPSPLHIPALRALQRAELLAPQEAAVRTFLGIGLSEAGIDAFNSGQYSLAQEYWEESLAYIPINPTPWYGLSLVNFRLRRWDAAARCADQIVRLQLYLGTRRWTVGSQAAVAKSWAAFHRQDLAHTHEMHSWALTPEQW
jgi:tetratricopeptide (TPR) repeat protein